MSFRNPIVQSLLAVSLLAGAFTWASGPADSAATLTLSGTSGASIAMTGGLLANTKIIQSGGSVVGAAATGAATDTAEASIADTMAFGDLSTGDGTLEIMQMALRLRGSTTMNVRMTATTATLTNLSYAGAAESTGSISGCNFIKIGNGAAPFSGGALANAGNVAYGANWTTLYTSFAPASTNMSVMPPVGTAVTSGDKVITCSGPPSSGGSLIGATNFVEVYPAFGIETGYAVGPTAPGSGAASFNVVLTFASATGP